MVLAGLLIILAVVFLAPFSAKIIEEELETFLFVMGCTAVTVSSGWTEGLVTEAVTEPVKITMAVLTAGFLFRVLQKPIVHNVNKIANLIGVKLFAFILVVGLGFLSSVITAIIAALFLVEVISCLRLDRKHEIFLVILACFSIGFGAVLTPIGEPLSTIAVSKLKGEPYHADFFFLMEKLAFFVVPGIILYGLLASIVVPNKLQRSHGLTEDKRETTKDIFMRTARIYLFVAGLVLLGNGLKPVVDAYILKIPHEGLYWINIISAVLDNATLAAAEISPLMSLIQIKSVLIGLLISGGMLVPGNIPNIVSAGKLKIRSSEWASFGVPLGLASMGAYFVLLKILE